MHNLGEDPREAIPHRPPILCLDRLIEADAEHAVAERVVGEGDDVDRGELWEEGFVEGLAQTAAVLNAFNERQDGTRSTKGMLVGVRKFAVRRRARLGETVRFRIDLVRRIAPLTLMRGEARCGDELLASGELKFFVEAEA